MLSERLYRGAILPTRLTLYTRCTTVIVARTSSREFLHLDPLYVKKKWASLRIRNASGDLRAPLNVWGQSVRPEGHPWVSGVAPGDLGAPLPQMEVYAIQLRERGLMG